MIEEFINKFKFKYSEELEYIFTSGNCYYFAVILKDRFCGDIYYLHVNYHEAKDLAVFLIELL